MRKNDKKDTEQSTLHSVRHIYSKTELRAIKMKVEKAELNYLKALSNIEALAEYVQPFYEYEIDVSPSTDGAMVTDTDGELWTVKHTLGI